MKIGCDAIKVSECYKCSSFAAGEEVCESGSLDDLSQFVTQCNSTAQKCAKLVQMYHTSLTTTVSGVVRMCTTDTSDNGCHRASVGSTGQSSQRCLCDDANNCNSASVVTMTTVAMLLTSLVSFVSIGS
ncbi:uncharacterized protein LOC141912241 [Tubulanus polymorphus]|uniref:uncharacterized protein LOC141912241 n=1 Tax=Tubulanus polymorphus TaxID=672921 RepID=UPI003DA6BF9E